MGELDDLIKRAVTGAFLICAIILFLWLDRIYLPLLILVFITFATNEYFRFWHRKDIYPHTLAVLFPGYAICLLIYFEVPLILPGFLLFFFICFLSLIRFPGSRREPNFLAEVAAAVFGVLYISLLPSLIIPLRKMGFTVVLIPLIVTWIYDTFAYLTGTMFGRHKLLIKVSPKKSWEGTIIALPLTLPFTYLLIKSWLSSFNFFDAVIITLGIGLLGTIGDLFESAMKREVELKNASNVFPGHGGFLDRLDSLLFTIPFFYLYIIFRM